MHSAGTRNMDSVTINYQKVPVNWKDIAKEDSSRICETMRATGVQRLINADQSFFLFYPEDSQVIAPVGTKRVGTTIKTDEMKGCTVMGDHGSVLVHTSTSFCCATRCARRGFSKAMVGVHWLLRDFSTKALV